MSRCIRILLIMVMLFASCALLADDTVQDPTNGEYKSRFKVFTAEHEAVTAGGKIVKMQSIFKIDLDTGTVWRYRQGVDQKGKPFEEFFEVPNQ